MSVFDMLNVLRRRLLVTREELVKQVSMVSKDAEGLVDWVVLHPEFHSTLAKCAFFLAFDGQPHFLRHATLYKEERLSVKWCHAAKRESARMDFLDKPKAVTVEGVPPAGPKQQRKTCGVCDKTYGSRRQHRRHACLRPSSPSSSDETDDWRVRAEEEALEALALDEAGSTNSSTPPRQIASPSLDKGTPSESVSENVGGMTEVGEYCIWAKQAGIARECENDSSPATHVIMHGNFADFRNNTLDGAVNVRPKRGGRNADGERETTRNGSTPDHNHITDPHHTTITLLISTTRRAHYRFTQDSKEVEDVGSAHTIGSLKNRTPYCTFWLEGLALDHTDGGVMRDDATQAQTQRCAVRRRFWSVTTGHEHGRKEA
ncbi:hypothetical protein V8E53_009436 [Lactarius tabidus]